MSEQNTNNETMDNKVKILFSSPSSIKEGWYRVKLWSEIILHYWRKICKHGKWL